MIQPLLIAGTLLSVSVVAVCQDSLMYYQGEKITTAADWEKRRAEIEHIALKNIYGFMPQPPEWDSEIIKEVLLKEQNILYKEIAIRLLKDKLPTRTIRLSMFIPANQSMPVPIVLALNKCGNQTVSSIKEVSVCEDCTFHPKCKEAMKKRSGNAESLRGMQNDYWALDTFLQRGYAFATFHESDLAADTNSLEQGIFPFYPELKNETGWKIISAWAWGLQCAVDYLVTDKNIDSAHHIVRSFPQGESRFAGSGIG